MRKVIKKLDRKRGYYRELFGDGITFKFCGDISSVSLEDSEHGDVYYENTTGKLFVVCKNSTGNEWIELG